MSVLGCSSVVEHPPGKCEVMSFVPSIKERKTDRQTNERSLTCTDHEAGRPEKAKTSLKGLNKFLL